MRISPRFPPDSHGFMAAHTEIRSAALIWSVAAAVSLITARQLLIVQHGQWPFHLLVLQLGALSIWSGVSPSRSAASPMDKSLYNSRPSTGKRLVLVLLDVLACAVSLPLYNQAILHFENTAVLSMLSLSVFIHPIIASIATGSLVQGLHVRRLCILLSSMTLVMYTEYRLTRPGLVFGLSALSIYGFLQSLRHMMDPEYASFRSGLSSYPVMMLSTAVSCLVAFVYEDTYAARIWLLQQDRTLLIVLALNISATAAALRVGGHIICFNGGFDRILWTGFQQPNALWPILCTGGLVAMYTVYSHALTVYHLQIIGSLAAAACLFDVNFRHIYDQLCSRTSPASQRTRPLNLLLPRERHLGSPRLYEAREEDGDGKPRQNPLRRSFADLDAQRSIPTRVLIFLAVFCWLATLFASITDTGPAYDPLQRTTLDLKYEAHSDLDIVIASFQEHPAELARTVEVLMSLPSIYMRDVRVFIYSKNYKADLELLRRAVLPFVDASSIMLSQNIGSEAETYLAHILSHWETIGNHTIFLPAAPASLPGLKSRLENFFASDTGMLPLAGPPTAVPCSADALSDATGWSDHSGVVRDVFLHAAQRAACRPREHLLLADAAAFVASAARIRGVDRDVFARLRAWLIEPGSWVHSEPYLAGRADSLARPAFAPVMHRLWPGLLQCADPGLARFCPSLMAGWRAGGGRGDCQCLDRVDGRVREVVRGDKDCDGWSHAWKKGDKGLAEGQVSVIRKLPAKTAGV